MASSENRRAFRRLFPSMAASLVGCCPDCLRLRAAIKLICLCAQQVLAEDAIETKESVSGGLSGEFSGMQATALAMHGARAFAKMGPREECLRDKMPPGHAFYEKSPGLSPPCGWRALVLRIVEEVLG